MCPFEPAIALAPFSYYFQPIPYLFYWFIWLLSSDFGYGDSTSYECFKLETWTFDPINFMLGKSWIRNTFG
jgi:hypothetical protein